MLPVTVHIPVAGSYSSALAKTSLLLSPPATSTCPFGSNVAVCMRRSVVMLRVAVHTPVAGSYSSALAKSLLLFRPPATSTCPFGSNVAVWSQRALRRLSVSVHVLVVGSYNSEGPQRPVEPAPLQAAPPATNTSPFGSNVAV